MQRLGIFNLRPGVRRATMAAGAAGLAGLLATILYLPSAYADSPSDPRATFYSGNATTCAQVGFASDTQLGSEGNASDANVSGVVKPNAGSVQPGQGGEVDISITGVNIQVDAVVVKGGDGYNVYSTPAYLPPTLLPDQHYISPLNGGGNVPTVSHWFVCYGQGPDLSIVKTADAASVSVGSTIGFTVTVSNSNAPGTATADSVTLNDPLPHGAGVSWSISPSYTGPGSCHISGAAPSQTLSCAFGDLAAGAKASVHVSSGTTTKSAGRYANTATASATNNPPISASATTTVTPAVVKLYLGYADGLRTAPQHIPGSPWEGSPDTKFIGCPGDLCGDGKNIYDGGAILVENTSHAPLTLGSAKVVIGGCTFTPWANGQPVPAATASTAGMLILTETKGTAPQGHVCATFPPPTVGDDFDTSDTYTSLSCSTKNDGLIPQITLSIDGLTKAFRDTGQILNSRGHDSGCAGGNETVPWALMTSWSITQ